MICMDGLKRRVGDWIAGFSEGYCAERGLETIWREPLVGLADAGSPMFPELRVVAHPSHKVPQDYLPGARTVISYFMPFVREVVGDNAGGERPVGSWSHAYSLTNAMCAEMNRFIASQVEAMGFRAAVPEDAGTIIDGTYSVWSQRHVARIAGLGNFGVNGMLITEAGCAGRFFSVVTDIQCAHDAPCLEERCLFRIDGSCGRCMKACPVSALTGDGFRRDACLERCTENVPLTGEQICGKCLCAMPCSMRDPSK